MMSEIGIAAPRSARKSSAPGESRGSIPSGPGVGGMRDPALAEPFVSESDTTPAILLERMGTTDRN